MAAPITDYTTYPEVRGALGVNVDELPDATLALNMYALALELALKRVNTALPAAYQTIKAKAVGDRNQAEQDVFDAVQLYAVYQVATELTGLPLFSPKQITDGKAGFSRYADSPYKEAAKQAQAKCDLYLASLMNIYAAFASSSTPAARIWIGGGTPGSDPVLGT